MKTWKNLFRLTCVLVLGLHSAVSFGISANRVWFEFMKDGRFKVSYSYTLPEQREFRGSYVIFTKKKDAEKFYWALIRGADVFQPDPGSVRFEEPKLKPRPW